MKKWKKQRNIESLCSMHSRCNRRCS